MEDSTEKSLILDENGEILEKTEENSPVRTHSGRFVADLPPEEMFHLSDRRWDFIHEYLQHFDHHRAVRAVYDPSSDAVMYNQASNLMRDPKVRYWISRLMTERALPEDAVLAHLAAIASQNIEDFMNSELLDMNMPGWDFAKARRLGVMGAVKSIKKTEYGYEVTFHDKLRALELIGKSLGMFKETEINIDQYVIKVVRE